MNRRPNAEGKTESRAAARRGLSLQLGPCCCRVLVFERGMFAGGGRGRASLACPLSLGFACPRWSTQSPRKR
eukprot:8141434-Lingulodinium_polyedra.AAC.1